MACSVATGALSPVRRTRVDARPAQADDRRVKNVSLATIGGVCAVLTTALFVVGIAFMVGSGVQVLIPETGTEGREWIADVDDASGLFFVGAWLVILGGYTAVVALIGFWDALKEAGRVLVLAPILAALGFALVQMSHLIPIAMAYELVPDYVDADAATQATLGTTADTLAILALVCNYAGNALGWGVAVPMYAYAIGKTRAVPRWLGWLAWVVAVFAGWLSLLGPASSVIEGLTFIGFLGFFVFMAGMGIALLRRRRPADELAPAPAL
jgi:hypothetical protein